MAIFEIEGPDGAVYEVDAPDEQAAVSAFRQFSATPTATAAPTAPQERGFGQMLYDNIVGDPNDSVTSYGESLGQAINAIGSNPSEFITGGGSEAGQLGESLGTWLNRAGESMTLGVVGDEAVAGADAMIGRGSYEERLKAYREQEAKMSASGRLSADLAGGVLPASLGIGAVTAAPTLGRAMWSGAKLGAAAGGINGVMEGEGGFFNRLTGGATGAGAGFILGGAVPMVAHSAKSAYRGARDMVANYRMTGELGQALGVKPQTARALSETMGLDDPALVRQYLDSAGPHAMLADASPSATGALDAAMQAPGRASRVAHERITGRAKEAAQDMTTALDNSLGKANGAVSLSDDIRLGSAPARKATYDLAYSKPIDYSATAGHEIETLLQRVPADAVRKANSLMALEGHQSRQIMAQIAEDSTVTYSRMPDVRQLDYLTRALNDVAAAADGQGKLGGTTAVGRATSDLSRAIRSATKEAVPEYGKALDVASDAISERNALDLGFRLLSRNTTREEVADAVRGASQAEIAALQRGVRSNIDETLANVRAVISDHNIEPRQAMEALRQLSSPASQEKMKAILGPKWEPLKAEIDKAARALSLRVRVSTNSLTMGRTTANDALNEAIEPGALRQGKPVAAAREALATGMGSSKRAVNRLRGDAKAELADLLTRQGQGGDILQKIEQARARYELPQNTGQQVGLIANLLGLSAVPRAAEQASQGLLGLFR